MTRYVALYCRLSPRPDGSYEGVDLQEGWGREYAAKAWPGLPIEVFPDAGISAANGDHRPEFERFREWLADGRVAHVWCVEQSRLERREVEWFRLAAELDAAGVSDVHTARDGVVRVLDEIAGIKAVLAASEVRKIKRRVNDRLAANAAEGRPAGGIGYAHRRVSDADGNKTLELVPERAEIVREIADRILAGWGLITIARDLNARGIRGAQGGTISPRGVKHMVTSPSVAGHRVHQGRIVKRDCFPVVLDEDTWQAVCARLSQPRRVKRTDGQPDAVITAEYFGRSGARKYMISGGIAVCGVCRAPLSAGTKKLGQHRVPYLDCRASLGGRGCVAIKLEPVEDHVIDKLFTELDKPEFLEQLATDDQAGRRDEIGAALTALDGRRTTLARKWATGDVTDTEWQAARQEISEHEQRLRTELAAVPPPMLTVDIGTARQAWPNMTLEERREFVSLFIEHVAISKGWRGKKGVDLSRITIEWRRR